MALRNKGAMPASAASLGFCSTSPLYPDERRVTVKLGLARDTTAWLIEFAHGDVEILESELEFVEEFHL